MFDDDLDLADLARASHGMTGADIKEVLRRVQLAKAMQDARTGGVVVADQPGRAEGERHRPAGPATGCVTARQVSRARRPACSDRIGQPRVAEVRLGDRLAEVVALRQAVSEPVQFGGLLGGLHALGHGGQPEAVADLDQRTWR